MAVIYIGALAHPLSPFVLLHSVTRRGLCASSAPNLQCRSTLGIEENSIAFAGESYIGHHWIMAC